MGIIKQLPREVAERIAAGEVVERPSSIVKELVENALDAGATSITVDVSEGGKAGITIKDNGCGMSPDDLALSILRHATSKIENESDLFKVRTMGFRGEALAAISAVSKLAIETKINDGAVIEGARLEVDGGRVTGPVVAGCAGGTRVDVSGLFYNVPARQKFLRSANVEFGHIAETMTSLALAFPDVRFELSSEGKTRMSAKVSTLEERVLETLGEEFRDRLRAVEENGAFLNIKGWVATGGRARGGDVHVFLNKRPVRDRILMHAVTAGFGEQLPRGEFPAGVLWITIDPSKVDVNIHPAKREVRFENGHAVHDFVMSAVRKALQAGRESWIVNRESPEAHKIGVASAIQNFEQRRLEDPHRYQGFASDERRATSDPPLNLQRAGERRVLGQLGLTYIVCEGEGGALVLIDQHAAHERLRYDELKRQYSAGNVAVQHLLLPERIELPPKESAYLRENIDILSLAGFEVEPFGGETLLVKAVPALLGSVAFAPIFEEMAVELEEYGGVSAVDDALDKVFALVACHAQVRAGDKLTLAEMNALVTDILCYNVQTCPHGRPVVFKVLPAEIEKWFKRA